MDKYLAKLKTRYASHPYYWYWESRDTSTRFKNNTNDDTFEVFHEHGDITGVTLVKAGVLRKDLNTNGKNAFKLIVSLMG